jgi:IclR family transcriptional regulator, acetate operon repressor
MTIEGTASDDVEPKAQDRTTVRAVERAFELLGCFSPEQKTLTMSEAARAVDLPISTVSRLLGTLETNDFVRRLPDGRYMPGGRLLRIGVVALHGVDLYDLSALHLERLAKQTGETANLGIPVAGDQVLYLRQALSQHSIRHGSWIGRAVPIAGTAIGAAIRGHIGREGYSTTRVTIEPDVTALAAPVFGADGQIVAALSVTGPTYRMDDAVVQRVGALLVRETREMSSHLGAPRDPASAPTAARSETHRSKA